MAHTAPEGQGSRKSSPTSRLTLRAGVWYVGERRFNDYRQALKHTLGIAEKAPKPKPYPRPERLEVRPWWNAFLMEREAREQAREAREQVLRERRLQGLFSAPNRRKLSA